MNVLNKKLQGETELIWKNTQHNFENVNFLRSFFRLLKNLILRKFFHTNYNVFLKNLIEHSRDRDVLDLLEMKKLEINLNLEKKKQPFLLQIKNIQSEEHFYLKLKINLINQMKLIRPQYFQDKFQQEDVLSVKSSLTIADCLI